MMGIDTRVRLNLMPTTTTAPGKRTLPRFDLVAGPLALCRLGATFLAAQAGLAVIDLDRVRAGTFALLGFGAVL